MNAEEGEIGLLDKDENENIVVAIAENRARELCLAKISSLHGSCLEIFSLADSKKYIWSSAKLIRLCSTVAFSVRRLFTP